MRVWHWFREHWEWEHRLFALIAVAGISLIAIVILTDRVLYQGNPSDSTLISAIVQGLATILALLVTLSLVGTQLASGLYTPRIISHAITSFWLWFAVFIYIVSICWSVLVLSLGSDWWQRDGVDVALITAGIALAYIAPFTLATLKSLQPASMARWLVKKEDYASLNELMRRAVNDGVLTLLVDTLAFLVNHATVQLGTVNGEPNKAQEVATLLLSVGRHSCQRHSPDAVEEVMKRLTELIRYCNESPRWWRAAADVFNEGLRELYAYSEEWIGSSET